MNNCTAYENHGFMRRIAGHLSKALVLLVIVLVSLCVFRVSEANAKTMTKAQVQKEVKKLQKEIKNLKKKLNTAKKNNEKLTKGYTGVFGDILSTDPCIIKNINLLGNEYLWVKDSQNLQLIGIYAGGYVKKTGDYYTWNGITVAECKAVKLTDKYDKQITKFEKQIEKKQNTLNLLKNDLKGKISVEKDKTYYVKKGNKFTPDYSYPKGKYSKLQWSSSNEKVVTVNQKGEIKAVGYGSAVVTIKASISGSKAEISVYVTEPIESIDIEKTIYINYNVYKGKTFNIPYTAKPNGAPLFISICEDTDLEEDEKNATELVESDDEDGPITLKVLRVGIDEMTIWDYTGKKVATVSIRVYEPIKSLSFKQDKYYVKKDMYDSTYYAHINIDFSPKDTYDKIWYEYDKNLIELRTGFDEEDDDWEFEDGYYVILLTEQNATVTVRTDSGLSATCEVLWPDEGSGE